MKMIKIENVDIYGWESAIRGMRNPMNSWDKSDSFVCKCGDGFVDCKATHNHCPRVTDDYIKSENCDWSKDEYCIGDNDLRLMKNLSKAGNDHGKFMRMITVYVDITAPLYWWKEFDTYKVGTVANSCSTMHKIHAKEFTLDDFSHEHLLASNTYVFTSIIDNLNVYRGLYLQTKHKAYWWQMIQLLPSSYNQKRTVQLNYAVLKNMYHSRKNHKLDCWVEFCKWIETLPHSELITNKED